MSQRCVQEISEDAQAWDETPHIDGATLALAATTLGPCFALLSTVNTTGGRGRDAGSSFRNFSVPGFCQGAGHTIAGCSGDMLVYDIMELVAMREGVPVACFYLVGTSSKSSALGNDSF